MEQPLTKYEGTTSQLAEQLLSISGEQKYRMTLTPEVPVEENVESLDAATARMASRTPEEISCVRERILAATPPPRELPDGTTIFDVVMGKWPGHETDEQISAALENLS